MLCLEKRVLLFVLGVASASAQRKVYCCCLLSLAKKNFCGASKNVLPRKHDGARETNNLEFKWYTLQRKDWKLNASVRKKSVNGKKRETGFGLPWNLAEILARQLSQR